MQERRKQKSTKISNIRYFGKTSLVDEEYLLELDLDPMHTVSYKKMTKGGCYFATYETDRTNCCFAFTKDGQFIQLIDFFVDKANEK